MNKKDATKRTKELVKELAGRGFKANLPEGWEKLDAKKIEAGIGEMETTLAAIDSAAKDNPCFGKCDPTDKVCKGGKNACEKTQAAVFALCESITANKATAAETKKGARKPGAGSTVFGHRKNTIAGNIDEALLGATAGMSYKEIADAVGAKENRIKDHVLKDLAVGKRTKGSVLADINTLKDGRIRVTLKAA